MTHGTSFGVLSVWSVIGVGLHNGFEGADALALTWICYPSGKKAFVPVPIADIGSPSWEMSPPATVDSGYGLSQTSWSSGMIP